MAKLKVTPLAENTPFPAFSLEANDGNTYTEKSFAGQKYVVYFYPKASTPGCTAQACGLEQAITSKALSIPVLGVSPDSVKRQVNFATKYNLPFPLLADEELTLANACGVYGEKSMCGKTYNGVYRIAFLVDATGTIEKVFTDFKAKDFAEVVIAYLAEHK